jgi:FtsP/CotA-like multicopper oxidase with cupredoxin domain
LAIDSPPAPETTPTEEPRPTRTAPRWLRIAAPIVATVLVVTPIAYLWLGSLMPAGYSVLSMGIPDYGGGPVPAGGHDHGGGVPSGTGPTRSVSDLVADPSRKADVVVDLVARAKDITVAGRTMPGYTINDTTPGPTISAVEGQLIEVHLRNESVTAGMTLHWHGMDVPNADDGVAGVTQNAVMIGQSFTYRFVADHAGTYWYHSHQISNEQVSGGLFGPLVIRPRTSATPRSSDVTAIAHTYAGIRTINGEASDLRVPVKPGRAVRVRVINTDNAPMELWSGAAYRVLAIDGRDLRGPTPVTGQALTLTGGGRADVEVTAPGDGTAVRLQLSKATAVIVGSGDAAAPAQPGALLDLLHYGTPQPLPFDPTRPDRRFMYSIGHRPGFFLGKPGLYWSVNGRLYPNVPMYVVREGDVAVMTISNHSGEVHPMHLHGHHAVVLSRNGIAATGSPWWIDSLNVLDGETYVIAFQADNPGIWMDHCHNLKHAAQGMVAHLMYEGVSTPFRIGGDDDNRPE